MFVLCLTNMNLRPLVSLLLKWGQIKQKYELCVYDVKSAQSKTSTCIHTLDKKDKNIAFNLENRCFTIFRNDQGIRI